MQDKYLKEYDLNQEQRKKDEEEWARLTKGIIVDSITEKPDSENQENRNSSEVKKSPVEHTSNQNQGNKSRIDLPEKNRIMGLTRTYYLALLPGFFALAFIIPLIVFAASGKFDTVLLLLLFPFLLFWFIYLIMFLGSTFSIIHSVNRLRHQLDRSDTHYIVLMILGLFGITYICGLIGCTLLRNDLALKPLLK